MAARKKATPKRKPAAKSPAPVKAAKKAKASAAPKTVAMATGGPVKASKRGKKAAPPNLPNLPKAVEQPSQPSQTVGNRLKAGFGARCAACRSEHRPEIDKRLLRGESTRTVSRWLRELGEVVSHNALGNHKREHCSVAEAIAERAAAAQQTFDAAVKSGFNRIELLEEQVEEMRTLRGLAVASAKDSLLEKGAVAMPLVVLINGVASEVRQSISQLQKVLGEEAPSDDNRIASEIADLMAALEAEK